MQIAYFPDSPRPAWPRPVVALGNFDGLHRGHMKLVDEVRRQAAERGGTAVAMTFDPHPARILRPDKAPRLLMTLDQKLHAFERAGLQAAAFFTSFGIPPDLIIAVDSPLPVSETQIIDFSGKLYTAQRIAGWLELPAGRIRSATPEDAALRTQAGSDIVVILGSDADIEPVEASSLTE